MKTAFLILTASLLPLLSAGAAEKEAETNAYRLVFFDKANKAIADATLFTPEFKKEDKPPRAAKWEILIHDYPSDAEEVKWFRMLTGANGPKRDSEVETRKEPTFVADGDKGAHVRIFFHPTRADSNINATLNLDEKEPTGTWSYSIFAGGFTGGKVTATRILVKK